jgi:hypothetical protein
MQQPRCSCHPIEADRHRGSCSAASRSELWCIGDSSAAGALADLVPEAEVAHLASSAELVTRLEDGGSPKIIVACCDTGSHPSLPVLAALRTHPHMPRHGVFVRLTQPLRAHVVRCARMGLVNVLAADAEASLVQRRLRAALNYRPRATDVRP